MKTVIENATAYFLHLYIYPIVLIISYISKNQIFRYGKRNYFFYHENILVLRNNFDFPRLLTHLQYVFVAGGHYRFVVSLLESSSRNSFGILIIPSLVFNHESIVRPIHLCQTCFPFCSRWNHPIDQDYQSKVSTCARVFRRLVFAVDTRSSKFTID